MEKDELKKDIENMVADIWSEKEEADVRKKTEEALQKSADVITELTDSLEDKNSEVDEITEKLTASDTKIKELETELEAAGKELEKSKEDLIISEKGVDSMKKDKAADIRMVELVEVGVVHSDIETQTLKVRDMSDEDFASYRDELVSLKEAVEERLTKAAIEAAEREKSATADEKEKDNTSVSAAEIDKDNATKAALNLETASTEEVSEQYKEMGKSMAALWTKKKD